MLTNRQTKLVPTRIEKDPTGQAGNRRKAKADIGSRVNRALDPVLDIVDSIPVISIENNWVQNRIVYRYDLSADRFGEINTFIRGLIYRNLGLMNDRWQNGWFFERYLGIAYGQGTAQAANRIGSMIPEEATDANIVAIRPELEIERILTSEPYRRRIELVYARAFENMEGFAGQASQALGRVLANGVALGKSPRQIQADIRKVFKQVSGYRALRIARTEINKAFTDARAEQTVDARDRLGLDVRVMHVSALVQNTRRSHAARHGKLYTVEQQNEWWSQGSNRIQCLCSTVEILFIDGKPVQKSLIERQRARGEAYFKA